MNNYPIIFLHKGNPEFLSVAIKRLKLSNSDAEIILLGDNSNSELHGVKHFLIEDYFENAKIFDEEYYVHMSKNPYNFELICYQRWFIIEEFALKNNYEKFWYLDSDVIVFGNLNKYLDKILSHKDYDLVGFDTFHSGGGDSFMPCFNFYTLKIINGITSFFLASYTQKNIFDTLRIKWRKHQTEDLAGGICDMTQIKLFFDVYGPSFSIYDSYDLGNLELPDGNVNSTYNYLPGMETFKMYLGIKYIEVSNYEAHAFLNSGRKIKLIASHFQSFAKSKMKSYAKRNYNPKNLRNIANFSINYVLRHLINTAKTVFKKFI